MSGLHDLISNRNSERASRACMCCFWSLTSGRGPSRAGHWFGRRPSRRYNATVYSGGGEGGCGIKRRGREERRGSIRIVPPTIEYYVHKVKYLISKQAAAGWLAGWLAAPRLETGECVCCMLRLHWDDPAAGSHRSVITGAVRHTPAGMNPS